MKVGIALAVKGSNKRGISINGEIEFSAFLQKSINEGPFLNKQKGWEILLYCVGEGHEVSILFAIIRSDIIFYSCKSMVPCRSC